MTRKHLILGGALAAAVYVLAVVVGGAIRPGYSHVSQFVSELITADAPNAALLNVMFATYNVLTAAFAWALLRNVRAGEPNRRTNLGIAGAALLAAEGLFGLLTLFFPQDPVGAPVTPTGIIHIVLAGLSALTTMAAMLLLGMWFRAVPALRAYGIYSFASAAFVFVLGGVSAASGASQSPVAGLLERLTIGGFLQWMAVVSVGMYLKSRLDERYAPRYAPGPPPRSA